MVEDTPTALIGEDDTLDEASLDQILSATPSSKPAETILLVDDDDQIRSFIGHILRAAGYTVLTAQHADEAIKQSDAHGGIIALLLTDVVMPGWNGRQLAEHLKQRRPGLRELYMSGYVSDSIIRHGMMDAGVPFLQKPFTPTALVRAVHDVLY